MITPTIVMELRECEGMLRNILAADNPNAVRCKIDEARARLRHFDNCRRDRELYILELMDGRIGRHK